jgi:hypothetical protein
MKIRFLVLSLVLLGSLFLHPAHVYACDAIICLGEILGFTDAGEQVQAIADRDAERRERESIANAQRMTEVANINAIGNERLELARAQTQRELAAGQIGVAEANGKYATLQASIEAIKDVKIKELDVLMQTQLASLDNRTAIIKSENESPRETNHSGFLMPMALMVLALSILFWIKRRKEDTVVPQPTGRPMEPETIAYPVQTTYQPESEDKAYYIVPQSYRVLEDR